MTDTALETAADGGIAEGADPAPSAETPAAGVSRAGAPGAETGSGPPPGLPEKFWDSDANALRTDHLVKSYLSLEHKLGALAGKGVPESADGYHITSENELLASDPHVNARLHAAGFSQDQAQAVYDLAAEYMLPMVSEMAAEFQAQTLIDRLSEKFGGEDKWRETAAQLKAWGRSRFPDEVFKALSSTYEGVLTMHKMMSDGEPGLIEGAGAGDESLTEVGLKQMMQDPRYWRDHDPSFVQRVQDGFKRLFPD